MNAAKIIADKRDGKRISDADISALIKNYSSGEVPDYQMAAFAMAVYFQGMLPDEVVTLTNEMLRSGTVMEWPGVNRPVVDKHSTGGIGDKTSIVLAPALAACGLAVPMISGRGLGATGGTLDKLESIPGFRTDLSIAELQRVVREVGCVITGASEEIAPADRRLYALRDVTATVPSKPLITASILSKKLAEGLDAQVLDVKWGSGSFMKTIEQAEELARSLLSVASQLGVKTTAIMTDMNQPLGQMVGNAVEIEECISVLKGQGPRDIEFLTKVLGGELLVAVGLQDDEKLARDLIGQAIESGAALELLERMVVAQGGDLTKPLCRASKHVIEAERRSFLASVETDDLGWAVIDMGGGRRQLGDRLDHSTGLQMLTRIGDPVGPGQPIMNVFCDDNQFAAIKNKLISAIHFSDEPVEPLQLVNKRLYS